MTSADPGPTEIKGTEERVPGTKAAPPDPVCPTRPMEEVEAEEAAEGVEEREEEEDGATKTVVEEVR